MRHLKAIPFVCLSYFIQPTQQQGLSADVFDLPLSPLGLSDPTSNPAPDAAQQSPTAILNLVSSINTDANNEPDAEPETESHIDSFFGETSEESTKSSSLVSAKDFPTLETTISSLLGLDVKTDMTTNATQTKNTQTLLPLNFLNAADANELVQTSSSSSAPAGSHAWRNNQSSSPSAENTSPYRLSLGGAPAHSSSSSRIIDGIDLNGVSVATGSFRYLLMRMKNAASNCNQDHAPQWVRAAFHDCGTFDTSSGIGGCDGSLKEELTRPENLGLRSVMTSYIGYKATVMGLSMADVIAIGAKLGLEACAPGLQIDIKLGRKDSRQANAPGALPKHNIAAPETKDMFIRRMGFTLEETVALVVGAHSIGRARGHDKEMARQGALDQTPSRFDNSIFLELVRENDRATRFGMDRVARIPADQNIANDPEMRPIVEKMASDSNYMAQTFKQAYEKMLEFGAGF